GRAAAAHSRRGKSGLHGDTVPANGRRGQPQGKCHREETASAIRRRKGEKVREERNALSATKAGRQTPPGAKPNRNSNGSNPKIRLRIRYAGWLLEAPRKRRPRGMAAARKKFRLTEPGLQAG